jgi:hypothetical protein
VKYADGPTVTVEVMIEAPVSVVWEFVTDIDLPARFSDEFRGARWLDSGPALGARFVGRNWHNALGEWETTSIIDRYDPPRSFGWRVSDADNPSASWWFELEEELVGTRLVMGARMGPAPSGLSIAIDAMPNKEDRIVARRLEEFEENMTATLEGIRQLAESSQ